MRVTLVLAYGAPSKNNRDLGQQKWNTLRTIIGKQEGKK